MMYKLIIDNMTNDERIEVLSPIIPNVGDYVKYYSNIDECDIGDCIVKMRDFIFKDGVLFAIDLSVDID